MGDSGDAGLWHEVVEINPNHLHTLYRNVDLYGVAAAIRTEPADVASLRRLEERYGKS